MIRQVRAVAFLVLALPAATGQSQSSIGSYLFPWHMGNVNSHTRMTPDGSWIFFAEAQGGCSGASQRLSMIRPDGTGYRVILTEAQLDELKPTTGNTYITDMRVSGDGKWLFFQWPHSIDVLSCAYVFPNHSYLVDVDAGEGFEWIHNGYAPGHVSFTDDGSTMAFVGYDAATETSGYHLANPDGSGAVLVLSSEPWLATPGMISPDGKKLLFAGWNSPWPYPADLLLLDIASQQLTQLTLQPVPQLGGMSCSYDGSRIVYGAADLWALKADGSDRHIVVTGGTGRSATVTRDGQYIFYADGTEGSRDARVDWNGNNRVVIDGYNPLANLVANRPASADGSVLPSHLFVSPATLDVWYANPPMLTTYGYGTPGTTLTWEVGGQPGDAFLVTAGYPRAPLMGSPAAVGLGEIGLGQILGLEFGLELGLGRVSGPHNVGCLQQVLPPRIGVLGPVEVAFQATLFAAAGGPPQATNTTKLTLGPDTGPQNASTGVPRSSHPSSSDGPPAVPASLDPLSRTADEVLRELAFADPQVACRIQRGELTLPPGAR